MVPSFQGFNTFWFDVQMGIRCNNTHLFILQVFHVYHKIVQIPRRSPWWHRFSIAGTEFCTVWMPFLVQSQHIEEIINELKIYGVLTDQLSLSSTSVVD